MYDSDMEFIKPDPSHFSTIAALHNRAILPFLAIYSEEEKAAYGDTIYETAETLAVLPQNYELICAIENDVLKGFAIFRQKNAQTLWISSLYVDPDQQRQGTGGKLLDYIETCAREKHCGTLALETHGHATWAIEFYLNKGFSIVNDPISNPPYGHILDKPPVQGRPILAKRILLDGC